MNHSTSAHLGDCFWQCLVLMKIPGSHVFYCNPDYHWQLREVVEGHAIEFRDVKDHPSDSLDCWIANGRFEQKVSYNDMNNDIVGYLMRWFNAQLEEAGECFRFTEREQMLLDCPAIRRNVAAPPFDILFVNCHPQSGQVTGFNGDEMNAVIERLSHRHRVLCTNENPHVPWISASICNIGNLSNRAKLIIAVASGAHWGTWNVLNRNVPRHIMLDPIRMNYGWEVPHHANCGSLIQGLEKEGWL